MKTKTRINRLFAFIAVICFMAYTGYGMSPPKDPPGRNAVKALLLVDDLYGGSLNIEDNQNNILENFEAYGWEVSIACCSPEVNPCPWAMMQGCEVLFPDIMTYQLDDALEWDVIVVVPGGSHGSLMSCPFVLSVLSQAKASGIPIAAWCRGVRLLAEADIINGVEITGHADYEDEYLAAGAVYLGNFEPPTEDNGILTCVNATEYRQEMCELIRDAVENSTSLREDYNKAQDKLQLKLYPNPIKSSSCLEFDLDETAVVRIAIFDRHGKMVLDVVKQQFDAGHNHVTFSPSSLPTGIYYLYVFSGGQVGMRKCMII